MNVVLDNNALIYLLNPRGRRDARLRLRGLLTQVEDSKGLVLIPAPVLTEYLSHAPERALREKLITAFRASRWVKIAPFDELAAVECAALDSSATATGNKRAPLNASTPWQSVKIDRQIVAIAKVRRASIVSGDSDVLSVAKWAHVEARKVEELPVPESERQLLIEGVKLSAAPIVKAKGTAAKVAPATLPPPDPI